MNEGIYAHDKVRLNEDGTVPVLKICWEDSGPLVIHEDEEHNLEDLAKLYSDEDYKIERSNMAEDEFRSLPEFTG